MDSAAQITNILELVSKAGVGAAIVLVASAGLVWLRTSSAHTVLYRIWTFFVASRDCNIKSVQQFHERQLAVLQFRFTTGIKVRTLPQMESLIGWADENNEDIGDVAACGPLFDLELPGLKGYVAKYKWWSSLIPFFFSLALFLAAIFSTAGIFVDRAIVRLTETGTWLTLDNNYAKPLWTASSFRLRDCSSDLAKMTNSSGFSLRELQIICSAFTQDDAAEYIRSTVKEQKLLFPVAAAVFFVYLIPLFATANRIYTARAMHSRISRRRATPSAPLELI